MAKIKVDIPDNYVKFIQEWQQWNGESADIGEYIREALKSCIEGDWCYISEHAPQKADLLEPLTVVENAAEA